MPGDGFRASLSWLHTWAGVLLGGLLLAVFWSGSLVVFDREIDRWMLPSTRLGSPPVDLSLDRLVVPHAQRLAGTAARWSITLPSERTPVIQLEFPNAEGVSTRRFIDPANGELLPDHGSWAATGFLFPFHYSLHLRWRNVGYWLLGIAGMGMLLLLVSGVVIHRKIIREFFTFRPHKSTQRATLDLHNLTGVVALPFHFLISLSGLIIFFAIYFPTVIERIYPVIRLPSAPRHSATTHGSHPPSQRRWLRWTPCATVPAKPGVMSLTCCGYGIPETPRHTWRFAAALPAR